MTDTQTPDQSTASPEKRDTNTIGVLVKAFHTLETIAEIGRPMPLRDIAEATGLPKGTLFRVLQTLTTLGYAAQMADTGYYYLTGRLSWLGRDASEEDLKMLTMPLMKELQAQFNETVNLGLLEGTYVYYATVLEADRPLSWRVAPGSRDTYYSTALGRAIAAHLEPAKLDKLIEQTDLKSRTENTVNDKAELVRILNKVKARGLSFDREENDHGVVCIGVPGLSGQPSGRGHQPDHSDHPLQSRRCQETDPGPAQPELALQQPRATNRSPIRDLCFAW